MEIWNHVVPIDNHRFALQLVPEYHYIYVIMHMMNHFLTAGTGIRSIMDVWVMNQRYADTWDRNLIEKLLSDYGLSTFERYTVALSDKWFGLEGRKCSPEGVEPEIFGQYEKYILDSGTYGTAGHSVIRQMKYRANGVAKVKYFVGRFFLPYEQMKKIYPVVDKYPVVLPIMWCNRIYDMFRKRGTTAKYKIQVVANSDWRQAAIQKALMEAMMQ